MSVVLGSSSPASLAHGAPRTPGELPWAQGDYTATGIFIAAGALDRFFAARNASALQPCVVSWEGDSTVFGQTLSGPYYSPIQRVRELLGLGGYTDGGHGNLNGVDDVTSTADSMVIGQGFDGFNNYLLPGESKYSEATGDNFTVTRNGRYLVIPYVCFNASGRFTYEIDGSGTEVPIDPAYPTTGAVYTFAKTGVIDLGSDGIHTIKFRNKGGRLVEAPTYTGGSATGSGSGGSLTAGTYDYAAAFLTSDGKIGPLGATKTVTITSGQTYSFLLLAQPQASGTSTNIYRRVSGVGNFKLIGNVATNTNSAYFLSDTGLSATTDHAQSASPVLNPDMKYVNAATFVTRATGAVLHNFAARASTSYKAADPYNLALALGLDLAPTNAVAAVDRALDNSASALRPSLLVFSSGINDQQASASDNSAGLKANAIIAIRAARHAGADALVTIPAFEAAANQDKAELYRTALKEAAEGERAAWVDIGKGGALPGLVAGITTNPHLTQAQYQTQGDFIYTVLGAR